jgi:hypothetical protein
VFSITSLLFNDNDQPKYISKVIESNLINLNNIHDVQSFFSNSSSSSRSSSSSSSGSSSSSSSSSLPSKTNLKDMNLSEKEWINKIKQQKKNIAAEITKKRILILEMNKQIREKNKLHNDLTNQENDLSATITFSIPYIEKNKRRIKRRNYK